MRLRANGPSIPIAWAKAISIGPGNMTNHRHVQGQRPGDSDFYRRISRERLGCWPARQMALDDLARRFAVGQAIRTNGPLARNRSINVVAVLNPGRAIMEVVEPSSEFVPTGTFENSPPF